MRNAVVGAVALSCVFSLSACGGGGGGVSSTPTPPPVQTPPPSPPPPPPPPPPPNTSLLSLTSSESFANDAVTASANFPVSGAGQTATAAASTATIAYDLPTRGYTITISGRSQTFLPGDIDNAQSTTAITVYVKRNGTTTDSLTLTKPGTSGRFTFEYVGGGYWQRTVNGASAISGNLEAFAYGVPTSAAAVPRSGQGAYSVDLIGAVTVPNNVQGVTGEGKLLIDFATGAIVIRGSIAGGGPIPFTDFSGSAQLSSAANSFGGSMRFGSLAGTVNGRFYGPVGQEVGAAFSATDSGGNAAVGTIIGRRDNVPGGNTNITATTADEFFAGDAARLSFTGSPAAPVAVRGNGVGGLAVYHDVSDGTYDLLLSDRSALVRNGDFLTGSLSNIFYAGVDTNRTYTNFATPGLQYLRAGRSYTASGGGYVFDDFVFGIATPAANMPRTGQAGFAVRVTGSIAETGANQVRSFGGQGTMIANFATGAINTQGSVENFFGSPTPAIGAFNGTATISSNASSFLGTLNFTGLGNYSGPLRGRFYGPAVNEVGAVFSLVGPNGSVANGVMAGANNPSIIAGRTGLLDLTQTTALAGFASVYTINNSLSPSESAGTIGLMNISYNPVAGSYQITRTNTNNVPGVPVFPLSITQNDRVAAESNALFDVYRNGNVTTRLFKPGPTNTQFVLTYTSFADITVTGNDFNGAAATSRYFMPFGIQTASADMPRTGTATYTGIAYATGRVDQVSSLSAAVEGTSRFDVDFGLATVSTLLTLDARNTTSGATASLGQFLFSGQMGGAVPGGGVGSPNFTGQNANNSFQGLINGLFFGANAAEIGAAFVIDKRDLLLPGSPLILIQGAAVGKRQ